MLPSIRNNSAMLLMIVAVLFFGVNDSHADAPLGQYAISNGTVVDMKSKLTWEQGASAQFYTWNDAMSHCLNLQLDGSGWRVPSMKELQSIVDETRIEPSIDVTVFMGTQREPYWSSSQRAANTGERWLISFDYGGATRDSLNATYPVRCVR